MLRSFIRDNSGRVDDLQGWELITQITPVVVPALVPVDVSEAGTAERIATTYLGSPVIYREVEATAPEVDGWVRLGAADTPNRVREERAVWIRDGGHLERLLGEALTRLLDRRAIAERAVRDLAEADAG